MHNDFSSRCPRWPLQAKILLWAIPFLATLLFIFNPNKAAAALLPTELNISTSLSTDPAAQDHLSFDDVNSEPTFGTATHTGSIVQTIGGTSTTTTINDTTATGDNPINGTLTDIGDGWEIHSDISGSFSGTESSSNSFYDLFFSLQNFSATDDMQIAITIDFSNSVNSAGGDAFAASEIQLLDGSSTELFFSDIESDTLFGNRFNSGDRTGDFGGLLDDNGLFVHNITLNPGDLLDFHVFHQTIGGAFVDGSSYSASLDAIVSFDARILDQRPVPEPSILTLLGIGLLGFFVRRRIN